MLTTKNSSISGVVERASKEISRRIHSLGFKTSSSKKGSSSNKGNEEPETLTDSGDPGEGASGGAEKKKTGSQRQSDQDQLITESDRLNGNNQAAQPVVERLEHAAATPPGSPSTSSYRNMGSIIKGSVMDKVTNVFSGQTMGNSSNKEAAASSTAAAAAAAAKTPDANNAINIPKGEI